jgi:hypothetical protein
MVITISEGCGFLFEIGKKARDHPLWESVHRRVQMGFALILLILFTLHFPQFLKERRDPFKEDEIRTVLKDLRVDSLMVAEWTTQVQVMKGVREYFHYTNPDTGPYALISDGPQPYQRVAWISHRLPLSPLAFELARLRINRYLEERQPQMPLMAYPQQAYRIIYAKEISSDVELDYSRLTKNGTNSFYFYVLERL